MQKLVMPFARQMMLCGYKNAEYRRYWGYDHYGIDVSSVLAGSSGTILASGIGRVVFAGQDYAVGGTVGILYEDCLNRSTGAVQPLVARYMHLARIDVKAGQAVEAGTIIGKEGQWKGGDPHLHIEFDTDTAWPAYSPQVAGSNLIKKGIDSTVNPSFILHVGAGQEIAEPTYNPAWLNAEDFSLPVIEAPVDASVARIAELEAQVTALTGERDAYKVKADKYDEIAQIVSA